MTLEHVDYLRKKIRKPSFFICFLILALACKGIGDAFDLFSLLFTKNYSIGSSFYLPYLEFRNLFSLLGVILIILSPFIFIFELIKEKLNLWKVIFFSGFIFILLHYFVHPSNPSPLIDYEVSRLNLEKYKEVYLRQIAESRNGYGGDLNFTQVERSRTPVSPKKLLAWNLDDEVRPDNWLMVYDESDEVGDPKTKRRYIGFFCASNADIDMKGICTDPPDPNTIGSGVQEAIKIEGHFYLVEADDPYSNIAI